jgi:hypothetical protein
MFTEVEEEAQNAEEEFSSSQTPYLKDDVQRKIKSSDSSMG